VWGCFLLSKRYDDGEEKKTNIKAFKAFSIFYVRIRIRFQNRKIKIAVKLQWYLKEIKVK
jgi:hypothetical protein